MKKVVLWMAVGLALAIAVGPAFSQPRDAARANRMRNEFQRQMESFREKLAEMQGSINDMTWELAKHSAQMDEVFDSVGQMRAAATAPTRATVMTTPSVSRRRVAGEDAVVSVGPSVARAGKQMALFAEDARAQLDRATKAARTGSERERLAAAQREIKALEEQALVMKQRAARERGLALEAPAQVRRRQPEAAPARSAPVQAPRRAPEAQDNTITITITIKAPGANVSVAGG